MVKRILMLDDEIPENLAIPGQPTPYMWYYASMLRKTPGLDVDFARTVEVAKDLFTEKAFDIVSIDIILPSNDPEQTRNNTRTGLAFFKWMAQTGKPVSVIILSLISKKTLHEELPKDWGAINSVSILEKLITTPNEFVNQLESL